MKLNNNETDKTNNYFTKVDFETCHSTELKIKETSADPNLQAHSMSDTLSYSVEPDHTLDGGSAQSRSRSSSVGGSCSVKDTEGRSVCALQWIVSLKEIEEACLGVNRDFPTLMATNEKLYAGIVFLYAKQVGGKWRLVKFYAQQIVDRDAQYAEAHDRLMRLIRRTGDVVSDVKLQSFKEFQAKVKGWDDARSSYVFHRDHDAAQIAVRAGNPMPPQRLQLDGLCFMHGPVIMQYYLRVMATPEERDIGMIDMTHYIRQSFPDEHLEKYIMRDEGGDSWGTMQDMLLRSDHLQSTTVEKVDDAMLRKHGICLIYSFEAYSDFMKDSTLVHVGAPDKSKKKEGHHAMVIIGVRMEGARKKFLVQNFWKDKQFVEFDSAYLEACRARIAFVDCEHRQTYTRKSFDCTHANNLEALDSQNAPPMDRD